MCISKLVYYLAVRPTDDVAYKLSNLVKRVILYISPALISEQHSYISAMFPRYKQSDI